MDWYYAINDRRFGPVSEERLEELRRAGEVHDDTLVWRSGFAGWRSVRDALTPLSGASGTDRMCTECRKFFSQAEMLYLNRSWVCAQCKPVFLQRLSEGLAPALGVGEMWRDGRLLVFNLETPFPDRCIRCNAPADGYRVSCQIQYAPSGRFVFSRSRAELRVGFCKTHRRRRTQFILACWLLMLAGVGLAIFGAERSGAMVAIGIFSTIVGLVTAVHTTSFLAARKMTDGVIWLQGIGKSFLAGLPEWTARK